MKVLITGAAGFIGRKLTSQLLSQGALDLAIQGRSEIESLILFDRIKIEPTWEDPRIESFQGDLTDSETIKELTLYESDVIFHLAAVVSGAAEKHFDLGMDVNLRSTLNWLESIRSHASSKPIFVFSSTCGVFGGDMNTQIYDDTAPVPLSLAKATKFDLLFLQDTHNFCLPVVRVL